MHYYYYHYYYYHYYHHHHHHYLFIYLIIPACAVGLVGYIHVDIEIMYNTNCASRVNNALRH